MTMPTDTPTLDVSDIQGNILRGYRKRDARHFALEIQDPAGAGAFLRGTISGNDKASPQVTTAEQWTERPPYTMNVGFTADGLEKLGLPESMLASFPEVYRRGPAAGAKALGDCNDADPSHWILGGTQNPPCHILVSLFTDETRKKLMAPLTKKLRALFENHGLSEISHHDAQALEGATVHFGYRDGIAQPRVEGVPWKWLPEDMQPRAKAGEFLLGRDYKNQFKGNFLGEIPHELGDNATYVAFRVLQQHVRAFEDFLQLVDRRHGMKPEMTAAKLMGRWRNGVPLVLSPTTPDVDIPDAELNAFDYGPTKEHLTFFNDRDGMRCPIGAHIRRLNPRSATVMGKPHTRRIIRRGMPYGPAFDPGKPDDIERGLVGMFICGDLESQFEFLQKIWVNEDLFTSGIRGTREPILGNQPEDGGRFVIRTQDTRDPIILNNLPRLVTTRGSVYLFTPGIGGLSFLADVPKKAKA